MHIILYVFRPFNGFYRCVSYILPITYCLMQKHTPSMFLTDFHTQKYTEGKILQVGIFLTVTPAGPCLYWLCVTNLWADPRWPVIADCLWLRSYTACTPCGMPS